MAHCGDVTYEINIQPRHGGRDDPELSLIVNDNSINDDEFLPVQPNDDQSDISKQLADLSRLQCLYHLKTERAFNEFQRMKEIYRDKDVDVQIMRHQGDSTWILMPKEKRWQLKERDFAEPASPDYCELVDYIHIPEEMPHPVDFSPYEGDVEIVDEVVLNPCPNPPILKRRRWQCPEPEDNVEPLRVEGNLPKRIRRDSFGFFNFHCTREELYDLKSDDEDQDNEHELHRKGEDLFAQ